MGSCTITPGHCIPATTLLRPLLLPKQQRQLFQRSPAICFKPFPGLLFPLIPITRFRCKTLGVTSAGRPIRRSRDLRSTSQQETSPKDGLRRPLPGVDSPDASTKTCVQCGHSKLLEDFENLRPPLDERTAACRACLAVLRARRAGRPLFHLGLSVEEAWEQAKTCTKCGVRKELRDFSRHGKGSFPMCRSCMAKYVKQAKPIVDTSQKCTDCEKVKPASEFYPSVSHSNGLRKICKVCCSENCKARYARRRSSPITLKLTEKMCSVCKQTKPAEEFHSSLYRDGLRSRCKTCFKRYYQEYHSKKRHASSKGEG